MSVRIDKAKLMEVLGLPLEREYNSWTLKRYFELPISYTGVYDMILCPDGKRAIINYTGYDSTYLIDIEAETMEIFLPASMPTLYPAYAESVLGKYCVLRSGGYNPWVFKDGAPKHGFELSVLLGFGSEFTQCNPAITKDGKIICFLATNTTTHKVYFVVLEGSSDPVTPIGYKTKGSQTASIKGVFRASRFRTDKHYVARKLYIYLKETTGNPADFYIGVYDTSLGLKENFPMSIEAGFEGWVTHPYPHFFPFAKDTDYWIGAWLDPTFVADIDCYFDDGETDQMAIQAVGSGMFPPDPLVPDSYANKKLSIYWL